ncbi:LysR family transcriptional regulator, partial [Bacillus amyloliquefaciens]|nr:LysR family transcriptional regulator [Bacillus amyloliquefaciens]
GLGIAILSQMSMSGISLPDNVVTRDLNQAVYRDVLLAVPSVKEASLAAKLFIQIAQELTKNE